MIKSVLKNKEVNNASWLIGGKVCQMMLAFFVSIFTARYLGPSNYGAINYAGAYVAFFTSLCTLGITGVIIKEFNDHPKEEGEILGTAIFMRIVSSILSVITIVALVSMIDYGEKENIIISALCSVALVFQTFNNINQWFQKQYKSKVTSMASLTAYACVSIYKIFLLIFKKNVYWFAFASSIDYIAEAVFLYIVYKKSGGPPLRVSFSTGKRVLSKSYHYILSGMMASIYLQTDKFMLKQMLGQTDVGYYSLASSLSSLWVFVLAAIIDSMYPTIISLHSKDYKGFERKNMQLYSIIFYLSVFVSLGFTLFGKWIILLLYGQKYAPAVVPLRIVTWYTAFSYLGVARNAWIVCEDKQKYLKYLYLSAAVINVCINWLFIPRWGTAGAATASLITQMCTSIGISLLIPGMRPNAILILRSIFFKYKK